MLRFLAGFVVRRPKAILIAATVALAIGAVYGASAPGALSPAGYEVTGSESTRASQILGEEFGAGASNVVLLLSSELDVDSTAVATRAADVAAELRAIEDVAEVVSYWETGAPSLRSSDGRQGLIAARIVADEDTVYTRVEQIQDELAVQTSELTITVGGSGPVNLELVEESERDLLRAEMLVIPLTTIIMLIVFRSVVAALLPLVVSAVAVIGTAVVLRALSDVTLVSIFALNLTTALGLGMGIDYSLLVISRWREERAGGASPETALQISVQRAGRSVLFSGLTTAATLAALLLFDYPLLRSLAYAGFVVVLLATVGALVVLPATMALLGDRVDAWSVRASKARPVEEGGWYRLTQIVMRRPGTVIVLTVAGLLLLGSPFLRAEFGIPDDRVLPPSAESRVVADEVRASFDARELGAIAVVVPDSRATTAGEQAAFAGLLSSLDDVSRVDGPTGIFVAGQQVGDSPLPERYDNGAGVWYSVVPAVEPISTAAAELVTTIRTLDGPADFLVGGESARLVDNKAEIADKLPFVFVWITVMIFGLLYLSFQSVLLPLKALLLNLLSLTAAFGAIVWIFQDGRLSGLLGYTPTGLTDAQTPVLMFCIAFGLSMDYEVFLLSRIKEEYDESGDPIESVARGVQRTGGIITAAAVLMAIVFLSFATGGVTFIQMVGIGLALSILVDALIVRALLVPAFMVVAGKWNWWSPFRHARSIDLREVEVDAQAESFEPVEASVPVG